MFILASSNEAFGRVYFEAMAAGLPVICAKDTGIDGYFKDETEVLAAYGTDVQDVKRKLEKLITSKELRETMGKTGKALVKDYTWTNIVKDYRSYYLKAVNKN
ncbi:MAG: glycosyltransferase family 4 protein [Bacteroidales bacterium]|nr:glycosyltransferase family 4 protein [Bacteroidales bacterium]